MSVQAVVIQAEALRDFAASALRRCGVPEADAATVSDNLVEANLRGVDTHGVTSLLGIYVKRLRLGVINPQPSIQVVSESSSTILFDGDNGLGAVVGRHAMEACIARARESGAAWAGVRSSNHFGACAYFSLMAARADQVGIVMTNGPSSMAPWGGTTPYMSTNPISMALPTVQEPVVLDMATSVVARLQIIQAAKRGEGRIPDGWALDKRGRPTSDPQAALEGLAMPLGGHKGYGLSLVIDALCGILTGGAFGPYVGSLRRELERPQGVGHLFGAVDVGSMVPIDQFKARLTQMCSEIRVGDLADGFQRIYVPGEIESEKRETRLRDGIPMTSSERDELQKLGTELQITVAGAE